MSVNAGDIIHFFESSKYILLALGSYVEGSGVMITGGFLLRLGEVQIVPLFLALWVGDFLSDLTLYFVGYFGARRTILRFGHILNVTQPVLGKIEARFRRYHTWILIISKLTMGFGFAYATLITAGMLRVPLWRYIVINVIGGCIWIPFLMFVGYEFGQAYESIHIPLPFKILFALVVLVLFLCVVRFVSGRLAKLD